MGKTALIRKRKQMARKSSPECHGGKGTLDYTVVLGKEDTKEKHLRFFFRNILPPGVSIGVHRHQDDEEYYYVLSGQGVMSLDGERFDVEAGDITAVFPGGAHGLENNADTDLCVLVVSVS